MDSASLTRDILRLRYDTLPGKKWTVHVLHEIYYDLGTIPYHDWIITKNIREL
jgi:hypothetical protein